MYFINPKYLRYSGAKMLKIKLEEILYMISKSQAPTMKCVNSVGFLTFVHPYLEHSVHSFHYKMISL